MKGLNYCCCGCSLKTGSTIIGTLSSVYGGVILLMILQALYEPSHESLPGYAPYSVGGHQLAYVVAAVVASCQLLFGIMLVMGADRGQPQLVRPWIFFNYFKFGMDLMNWVYFTYLMLMSASVPVNLVVICVVSMITLLSIEIYCIMVVHSFYKQLVQHGDIVPLKEQV